MKYILINNEDHYHSVFMRLLKEGYKIDLNTVNPDKSPEEVELIALITILDNKIMKILYKNTPLDCGAISNERVLKAMKFEEIT